MTGPYLRIHELTAELEREMREIGLWTGSPPAAEALSSPMPFCYDTLEFPQWLQWVFLPRLHQLIEQGLPLPAKSEMSPLAEMWVEERELGRTAERLLRIVREFDEVISSAESQRVDALL
jgi:uncharacterized protein YqcC (DUF446 family)